MSGPDCAGRVSAHEDLSRISPESKSQQIQKAVDKVIDRTKPIETREQIAERLSKLLPIRSPRALPSGTGTRILDTGVVTEKRAAAPKTSIPSIILDVPVPSKRKRKIVPVPVSSRELDL